MNHTIDNLDRLPALEAVERVRSGASAGDESACSALDRTLRLRFLRLVQDQGGDAAALRRALVEAADWAARSDRARWSERWRYLLELLRDSERLPSLARESETLLTEPGSWAATFVRKLAEWHGQGQPSALASETGCSASHVSNVLSKLEKAGLVVRRDGPGRWVAVILTARGRRLASLLGPGAGSAEAESTARSFWNDSALELPVDF